MDFGMAILRSAHLSCIRRRVAAEVTTVIVGYLSTSSNESWREIITDRVQYEAINNNLLLQL